MVGDFDTDWIHERSAKLIRNEREIDYIFIITASFISNPLSPIVRYIHVMLNTFTHENVTIQLITTEIWQNYEPVAVQSTHIVYLLIILRSRLIHCYLTPLGMYFNYMYIYNENTSTKYKSITTKKVKIW